ncbi:MAG: DUF3021 family protein [Lachnospiraceae bacterium]|nr:DUF3021 family protein [Lachnospiraceae bacterium]
MAKLKMFFEVFTTVTTCVVFGVAVYCGIFFPGIHFGIEMMWQILLVSLLTSAGTLMYKDELSKKSTKIRCVIHYLMVNVIVVVCGIWFNWFHTDDLAQVIGMLILIAVIFLIVSVVSWKKVMKEADLMNQKLAEYQERTDESGREENLK